MRIKETQKSQEQRLKEISVHKGIDYSSLELLIDSAKIKKLLKGKNYHLQRINEVIEKELK
mgnify:CR=1 FL=1